MKRYFEYSQGTSNKFWEITMTGTKVTTHWGRIGSAGRNTTKSFADKTKAKEFAQQIIGEKNREGYREKL